MRLPPRWKPRSTGAAHPRPGRPVLRRLNRVEYGNTIRDLLDVEIDASSLLPADESLAGFDNIGGVLSMSPSLLDRYLVGRPEGQSPGGWRPCYRSGLRVENVRGASGGISETAG